MARIQVGLDLRSKLYLTMDIKKENEWLLDLDYEGITFRCNRCHKYEHLLGNCTMSFKANHFQPQPNMKQRKVGGASDFWSKYTIRGKGY